MLVCVEVLRSRRGHVTGNWSYTRAEFGRDRMPAWCNGWLSITTPKVGAELAQVGTKQALRTRSCVLRIFYKEHKQLVNS